LVDTVIEEFWGVGDPDSKEMLFFYITLSGTSYRFFVDVGVLFWEKGSKDPEDDLGDDQSYINLLSLHDVHSQPVKKIEMKDHKLYLFLASGAFIIEEFAEKTYIKYKKKPSQQTVKTVTNKHKHPLWDKDMSEAKEFFSSYYHEASNEIAEDEDELLDKFIEWDGKDNAITTVA